MDSVWTETASLPRFEPIDGDKITDVLVIGGGIAGILCAHQLTQAGVDCLLVEAENLCGGITKNTTAKVTVQHGLIYSRLTRTFGLDTARRYYRANREALEVLSDLAQGVDCQWERQDAWVYSTRSRGKITDEVDILQKIGANARFSDKLPLPVAIKGAVCLPDQAQFHPLNFLGAMVKGLNIAEHTRVTELKPGRAVTEHGAISAKKIIVTTHFPLLNKHGSYFLKLYQHRSYVLALENVRLEGGMYVDERNKGLSFRQAGEWLLLGGGGGRTGKSCGGWEELRSFAKQYFPEGREVSHWATQDCMSLDGMAYIGQYSARTPELYVATGFNKWGMTTSMAAAILLTGLVQGKCGGYADLFSPSRTMLRPQLGVNAVESALHLLTPTTPRCPHLGCALHYNRQEHSWDCPCHGSRFTEDGRLIDNPATGDLEEEDD